MQHEEGASLHSGRHSARLRKKFRVKAGPARAATALDRRAQGVTHLALQHGSMSLGYALLRVDSSQVDDGGVVLLPTRGALLVASFVDLVPAEQAYLQPDRAATFTASQLKLHKATGGVPGGDRCQSATLPRRRHSGLSLRQEGGPQLQAGRATPPPLPAAATTSQTTNTKRTRKPHLQGRKLRSVSSNGSTHNGHSVGTSSSS